MSRRGLSNFGFIRDSIRKYYSTEPLEEPVYFHKREIALHSLEDNVYIRHLAFASMKNLYSYILEKKTPLHLYYSSAYYEDPGNDKMELKGWRGSDLMFDIDSDKYEGCDQILSICVGENTVYEGKMKKCPSGGEPIHYPIVTNKCIDRAFYDVVKLYDILRYEFGFKDIKTYFSGNRGFHVKVYDKEAIDLTSDERREIASYVSLEGLEIDRIAPLFSKRHILFSHSEHGLRRRIVNVAIKLGLETRGQDGLLKISVEELETLLDEVKVKIDPVVTMDVSRLSRFGFSLNCKSGLTVYPIDIDRYEGFDHRRYSPWEGGLIVKPLVDAELPIYGEKISLRRNESIYLEASTAFYLILKNIVEIVDVRDFGVRKCMTCS